MFFLSASNLQAPPGPLLFMILQFVALEISAGLSQTEPTLSQHNQTRGADGYPISSVVFPITLIHSWMTGIYDSVQVSVARLHLPR